MTHDNIQNGIDLGMVIPTLILSACAVICDKIEQHFKQDNLQRYQALLDKGMVILDKLDDISPESKNLPSPK